MVFHGFQKMTLLDFPGKVAATLFTGGCNFRCPFCHNALLVTELSESETYSEETILDYLKKRQGVLEGIAVTGGEPLLHPGIFAFLEKVRALGYAVKVDTNGSFPSRLRALVENSLVDYVAVDIKNCKEKYGMTIGVPDFDLSPVEETVSYLLSGAVPYEFRTTVVREFHTVDDIKKISEWIRDAERYYLQEFKDSGNLIENGLSAVPKNEMEEMKKAAEACVPNVALRGL